MKKNKFYLFYKDYFKNRNIDNKSIIVSKTKNSYLIGPIIDEKFDEYSFYKRIISNCIYTKKIYKNPSNKKILNLINIYKEKLEDNEVIEIFSNNSFVIHKIIKVPRDNNEKE